MSNPYPSRRELRLQRERAARATPRDTEAQSPAPDQPGITPDAAKTAVEQPHIRTARQRRRADSEVVSTGMIPIITKPRVETTGQKPRSRRALREQANRVTTQQGPETTDDALFEQIKPRRRSTAPQLSPPPVPAAPLSPVRAEPPQVPAEAEIIDEDVVADEIDVTIGNDSQESAAEITDISGLNALEVRRADLRAETEYLTHEIMRLGQANPNVIDPVLLRRQNELAAKSKELQALETASITVVEHNDTTETSTEEHSSTKDSPRRRARRAQSTPMITGPFDVSDKETPTGESGVTPEVPAQDTPKNVSNKPLDATKAHGLDPLDAKEFEAPERRLLLSAAVVFAIGIITLMIAIILLNR